MYVSPRDTSATRPTNPRNSSYYYSYYYLLLISLLLLILLVLRGLLIPAIPQFMQFLLPLLLLTILRTIIDCHSLFYSTLLLASISTLNYNISVRPDSLTFFFPRNFIMDLGMAARSEFVPCHRLRDYVGGRPCRLHWYVLLLCLSKCDMSSK